MSDLLSTPVGFALGVLGMALHDWQEKILWDANQPGAIALKAGNGSGKTTSIAAPLALWHTVAYPNSLTIITAGVYRQVKEQLFPALRLHARKFAEWTFNDTDIQAPNGSRIIGFSTDEAGRFEGWHNKNLLVIVDEAKSVPDSIFEAIERCQPTRLLTMSSPGGCSGFFYEAFNSRRKFFRQHTVTSMQCPHISRAWIDEQIEKYGEQSPLIRSMIFAEFMATNEGNTAIPLTLLERCLTNPPAFQPGKVRAFCDFAAGGDENVLALARGNRVEIAAAWREKDTMSAVGQFIRLFHQHNLTAENISCDAGGLGIPICDRLQECGWNVRRVNNGVPASKPEIYGNVAAEMWIQGARLIEKREIILPDDRELFAQLTTRLLRTSSRGQIVLEAKDQLRARGLPSPDRADAVLGCLYQPRVDRLMIA
ncbi:MAG: terminase family protein [Verrucomicrobiota bacterium]